MKIKRSLTLDTAASIVDQVLKTARDKAMNPMVVVVLDSGGHLVALKSEDGSAVLRVEIALGKAYGALSMGISSRAMRDNMAQQRPTFLNALAAASGGKCVPVPGGVLIVDGDGMGIGAVGVSGDTSERDEYCAILATQAAGFASDPAEIDPNWNA